jgi:purine-nucleoside phosphorylase
METSLKVKGMRKSSAEIRAMMEEAAAFIRERTSLSPRTGVILGSGLGGLARAIDVEVSIPYSEIPHFPVSTVEFHAGNLLFGRIAGNDVLAMEGRFHYYEGYSMQEVSFPVRVMKALGIGTLILSSACGGMNPFISPGDIMLIADHINLLGDNPLIGINDDELGPRFTDMSEPYSGKLMALAERVALEEKIPLKKGVYVAVAGPNLETRAEYRFLRGTGADVVGMSTVPEVIVAAQSGIAVLAFAVITDSCLPDALEPADIRKIIETAKGAEPKLALLIRRVIGELQKSV